MNDLTVLLSPQEEIDIENALKRLFTLRDKYIAKNDLTVFLRELSKSMRPYKAIIAGLDSLKDHSPKTITFVDMLNAIDKFVEKKVDIAVDCRDCFSSGFIIMKDSESRSFGLACRCYHGDAIANQGNKRWNGLNVQHSNGRELIK